MTFTDEIIKSLNEPLNDKHVKKPVGQYAPKGDYIEGWHAINEANRIFGFGDWSYEINSLTQCCTPYKNKKENTVVSYLCQIKVIVHGVVREDVGYGSGISKSVGDAHESATKEAVTDALKRALRSFGNQFGLALYDKSRVNVVSEDSEPSPENQQIPMAQQKQIWEGIKETVSKELLDAKSVDDKRKIYSHHWQDMQSKGLGSSDWNSVLLQLINPPESKEAAE